jgi:hypothetical protein
LAFCSNSAHIAQWDQLLAMILMTNEHSVINNICTDDERYLGSCCIVMDLPSLPLTPVLQPTYSVSLICSAPAWFQCNDTSDELLYNDEPSVDE